MVIDKLKNAPIYYGLGPRFRQALEWLAQADPDSLPVGQRITIDGDNVFATLFDTETLPPDQCKLEYHHNYADLQYLVSGKEAVGYLLEGPAREVEPYSAEKDIGFSTGDWDTVTVEAGTFYIVWPQDLHAPRMDLHGTEPVRRLVVKVKL